MSFLKLGPAVCAAAVVVSLGVLADWAVAAPTPAQTCEAGKNGAAGKYAACHHKAQQKFIRGGGIDIAGRDEALVRCSEKYGRTWQGLEEKAGPSTCPSEGDLTSIQGFLDACLVSAEEALSGADLPPDVLACSDDLATCGSSLTGCTGDLTTANADLGTCNGSLSSCQDGFAGCASDLSATNADLGSCNGLLSACDSDLATCGTDLSSCGTSLAGCNSSFSDCSDDLSTCDGNLDSCYTARSTCETDLDHCFTELSSSNADFAECDGRLTTCEAELAAYEAQSTAPIRETGQELCYNVFGVWVPCPGSGQDAEYHAGVPNSFADNGNGTITDVLSGLMWEKLDDNNTGGIHDKDNLYTWTDAFQVKIANLNATSFAGYSDWRLPNRKELDSLANLGAYQPAIFEEFDAGCSSGCTAATCSCTPLFAPYWSSTTSYIDGWTAWTVNFIYGSSDMWNKTETLYVRAVRGGL